MEKAHNENWSVNFWAIPGLASSSFGEGANRELILTPSENSLVVNKRLHSSILVLFLLY